MGEKRFTVSPVMVISTFIFVCYFCFTMLFRYELPMLLNWLGLFIFVYSIYTYKAKTHGNWFSPYTILMLFFTLFNYGQPIMWAFGIHHENEIGSRGLFWTSYTPSAEDMIEVQTYVCIAMLVFHIGVLLFTSRNRLEKARIISGNVYSINYAQMKKSMLVVCRAMLVFVTPLALYSKLKEVFIARAYGYSALYYGIHSTQGGYTQIIMYLFFPALVGCLIACDYSKKSRAWVYTIFGLYALLGLLSGDRGSWLYSLIIIFWLHTHYKKTSMRTYTVIVVLGVLGVYVLSALTAMRNSGLNISFADILSVFRADQSPIVDAFFEMGGSMGIITYFMHTGNEIFPYGNTYLTAILGVVSSRVLSFLGIKQVFLSGWFSQEYLGLSYGTGFSMLGEAYVNGGYYGGLIYMALLGMVHGKLLKRTKGAHQTPLGLFITVAGLNAVIGFARNPMYLVLKELFYGVILVWILIKLVEKYVKVD